MKKTHTLWITVLMIVLLPTLVFAGGYNLAGVGAKGLAMAGAFRAIADDGSAMYWNPAGLAGQEQGFWIEGKMLMPMAKVTPDAVGYPVSMPPYTFYDNDTEHEMESNIYPSGSAGYIHPINEKWTAGIAVFMPTAIGTDWKDFYNGPYYDINPEYPSSAWFSEMAVIDIHPTVGLKVNEQFSVGVGIAIKYAMVDLVQPSVIAAGLDHDGDPNTPPIIIPGAFVNTQLEGNGWGFGFNIGALYDVTEDFHVGLNFTGPTNIPVSGTLGQDLYAPAGLVAPAAVVLEAEPDADADFPIPMEVGIGLAYDFTENLTVAADVNWVNWEAVDVIDVEVTGNGPTGEEADDAELIMNWENSFKVSLGFNYTAIEDKLDIRGGYYYDPSPIPEESIRPSISDVADKHNISIGFQWWMKENIALSGYYEYVFSGTNEVEGVDQDGDTIYDNVPGEWSMMVNTIGLQLSYRF